MRTRSMFFAIAFAAAAVAGCDGPLAVADASVRDAAHADAGSHDASAGLDTAVTDAAVADAGEADAATDANDLDANIDAAAPIDAATVDVGLDANTCGFIGGACDSSMISAPDCPFGFVCYGGTWSDARASGVCLSAVGPRTVCDASHLCPGEFGGAGTRCYLPYDICLYSYEVECVCGDAAAASNCGPVSP